MVKKGGQKHEKNYKGEAVIIFFRKCYKNMLQSVPKIYKGRRVIIIFVQLKESTSQTDEKMYKDEDINFFGAKF